MDLLSLSPLQASLLVFRQASGEWTQTVVCKATFSLSPGVARLAPEQEAPNEDDNHWNDDPTRSLYAPSDLAPFKPRADVALVGNAFAPGGTPVRSLIARLTTAGVDKAIEVIGDRAARDGKVQEPAWFTSMPLRYERAAGGPENPVGVSPLARPDANGILRLPNLAPAVLGPRDPGAPILPAGFGPIAPSWPVRASKLGHHAKIFANPGWRQRPLPEGIDPGYWNAAPRDQQPQEIRDDEPITLENLHRGHARLVTVLPGLHPRVFAEKAGGPRREIKMTCDTLWIDTDRSICTLTWRGQVALASPDEQGRIAVAMEERNQRLSTADIDRLVAVARSRGGAPARDPAPAPSGVAPPGYDETYRLSSSQQRALPTGPAWLAPPKSERNVPAPPLRPPPPPPPPLLPVPATVDRVDRVEPAAAESPWAADVRAGIVATRPVVEAPAPPMAIPKAVMPLPPATDAMGAVSERASAPEVVELVWLDPKFSLKIRKAPAWKKLLGEAKPRTSEDDADLETSTERKEAKERRDVAWILKTGDAAGSQELDDALDRAMDDGTFMPPLALLAGDFDLPFDELEALKASIAVAASFAPADKQLKEALEKIKEASDAPLVDRAAAEKLTARLGEVFGQSQRSLPEGYLASQAARLLLEERRYQKRTLLGQAWIRGLLTLPGATAPVPAYLPDSLAQELPMFQRFRARLIAEARPSLDQYETQPIALRVVALARLVAPPRRRKSR